MTRGLPFSVAFHVLAMLLVFYFGNAVSRRPPQPIRSINVQMVRLPESKPPEQPAEQVVEPEVQQPKPEIKPELPPKEKPEPERKKPEQKPQEEVKAVEPEVKDDPPAESEPEPAPALMVSGPTVNVDEADFPFAWYAQRVEGLVWRNFDPHQVNFA